MERKIVIDDEWYKMGQFIDNYNYAIYNQVGNPAYLPMYGPQNWNWWTRMDVKSINYDGGLIKTLQRIEQVNLLRRNNLLLRDWSGRTTVKQLYYGMFESAHFVLLRSPFGGWKRVLPLHPHEYLLTLLSSVRCQRLRRTLLLPRTNSRFLPAY